MHAFCCFYMKVYAFSHKTLKQLKRFKNCALLFAKKKKKKKAHSLIGYGLPLE